MDLLNGIPNVARDSTNHTISLPRHGQADTEPYTRTLRSYPPRRARRHQAHNEPGHTSIMVNRDPHGRTLERGAIPRRRHLNTLDTRATNSMASPNGPHKTRSEGDRRHHPILAHLSRRRQQQPLHMLNLPNTAQGHVHHMSPPKMRLYILQGLKESVSNMPGDLHPDPRYTGNGHPISQPTCKGNTLRRTHHRSEVEPEKSRHGGGQHRPTNGPKHSVPSGG